LKHWGDKGVFALMMAGLAAEHGEKKTVMIPELWINDRGHFRFRACHQISHIAEAAR